MIIDRFEGDMVICETENREMVELARDNVPTDAKEGDVLVWLDGGYQLDLTETQKRKQRIEEKANRLFKA